MRTRKRIIVRFELKPVSRRWLLLLAMGASLPLSGQNQSNMNASFPTPVGVHGQMLVTGGAGAPGLSAFGRLGGTSLIGTAAPSPGAALAVSGNTLIGDINDASQTALSAYSLVVGQAPQPGPLPGLMMGDRSGSGNWWGLAANGGRLNFWSNDVNIMSMGANGTAPMCIRGPMYTFPGITVCPGTHPYAVVAVDGAGNRVSVASCPNAGPTSPAPQGPGPGCPIYGQPGNSSPHIAGAFIVCCNFH